MSLVELRVHGQLPKQLEQMAKLSLLHWSGELYSAFSSPALLYNGLAGISATPTCLDKMSGQQLFFFPPKCAKISFLQCTKSNRMKGFARAKIKAHRLFGEGCSSISY